MTDSTSSAETRPEGVDQNEPKDDTLTSCLLFEPPVKTGNISLSGLHFIASHKYRPSEYTHLDNFLNPMWTYLTELLPMWLAPNMVTTIGGIHCGVAYGLQWWYSPDFDVSPPDWVVFLAGWCTIAYYTLDCMDGKQARRTGSSSPLGQLFDHGFDCICCLFFMATTGSYLMIGGTYWYVLLQTSAQFSFFMAQWEEYHTHVLPHCAGKWVGVTETNYSLGLIAIANSFLDRAAFYQRTMDQVLAPLGESVVNLLPTVVRESELRHFLMAGWGFMSVTLVIFSFKRTLTHPRVSTMKLRLYAVSKLATPFALCVAAFLIPPDAVRTRYLSVTVGLAFSLLTKKMIIFSMAKMQYAVVQWDAVPFLLVALWIRFDERLTKMGADFALGTVCFWYAFRLLRWANVTINQICAKLDIYCFTLKKRKKD
eukprot:CAMPEP_0196134326 /NCGR_PEP_ID=MMETSP0910-20130528/3263_1 /TAXON_ID=49265 /ORGANISM="Thalassiosira rotula, Strain GSO102" /LENGTH=424 /DNA_ID=CAMNT_0041394225 /DNA_START=68 /DNA_END=1342 /DNA_ORIENTATION=-